MRDWRVVVAVLGGTGWFWSMVLPRYRDVAVNPGAFGSSERPLLLGAMVVLAAIDVVAVWYLFSGPREPK